MKGMGIHNPNLPSIKTDDVELFFKKLRGKRFLFQVELEKDFNAAINDVFILFEEYIKYGSFI